MIGGRSALLAATNVLDFGNWLGNYSDVSLLLRGNETPGPLLILDESPTPKAITAFGDAGISTTVFKYGDSSLAFDGTGDYLTAPSLALGSGAFTIEFWLYANAIGTFRGLFGIAASSGFSIRIFLLANGTLYNEFGGGPSITNPTVLVAGQWYHVAFVRSGNVHYLFVDGTSPNTSTNSGTYPSTTTYIGNTWRGSLGTPLDGYIDDLRVTKGIARYQSAFTPPTAELPANITDDTDYNSVSLLLRNGAPVLVPLDESPTPKAITAFGDAGISTSVFKYGDSSLAFDGTGDYLTLGGQSDFAFGTGDFTIEMWVWFNNLSTVSILYDSRPPSTQGAYPVLYRTTDNIVRYFVSTADRIIGSAVAQNTWIHIAVCRSGTSTRLFIDGQQSGSTYTDSTNYINAASRPIIGASGSLTAPLNGYIDDLRVTKGIARYTSNFLPPPAELPNF
jgi:hypothetical protein